ncbi:nucleoside 2-deoxyribosyltransferase [Clostridium estertheticum]|uniref:nucleoside 2-deoxyribosyltransferase n=1 Tax=Clostridium estertheticum TaxID=238834 RepID=UPI001C7D9092|nr:nucleoside 2-deoxyribosyltransferase [Clostridium estertheticum]MBX4268903.1 nucleoside 2-deoxyribosyltransferase [Clostridium estertheticum]WLC78904.1 nucleoside 2-deoxyribosyltransferase [Clostridium estertheticum]
MKDFCFVIQPFDNGRFDKRYDDLFKPALATAGIESYRVDKDDSVKIPIDTIEERIRDSRLCLADITVDNPNVWYEVGYAIARDKEIILMCSDERKTDFPFDIRHRNVLSYKTESQSDFTTLTDTLIHRTKAILSKPIVVLPTVSLKLDNDELSYNEIFFMGALLINEEQPFDIISAWSIKQDMKKSGLTEIACSFATRKLLNKKFIELENTSDYQGNEYLGYRITERGNQYIIENENKFSLEVKPNSEEYIAISDDDIPF